MRSPLAAAGVHAFTALGAACSLFATLAVIRHEWEAMFIWLGVALVIDAADGPAARKLDVKSRLPRFSGERLDLVIDYMTYVFIPALALIEKGFLQGWLGTALAVGIVLSSLFHFADTESKADDNSFVGFPAIWNVVAFYLFAFDAPLPMAGLVTVACVVMTFVPLKWVHPVRVRSLRPLTAFVVALWTAAAVWTLATGFPAGRSQLLVLSLAAVYGIALCVWLGRTERGAGE
jgi:phosphatidylcholine synthase